MKKPKPRLTLLPGKKSGDINMLVKLFTHLTGRTPTQQEIDDAKKILQS